ncbi:MAG: hypothetical protein H7201_18055 [Candidatus Saccharibacteria bacterium]|nr:hypothetical protein [Microbacteriaceae bacterium]
MNRWDEVQPLEDPAGWAEVTENGWGMLLAWVAGPENTRRGPTTDDVRTVRTTLERTGFPVIYSTEPFSAHDRDLTEEGINPYLEAAGVPPRPRGYTWFIRMWPPTTTADDFLDRTNASVLHNSPDGAVMPGTWRERMETTLTEIYAA